MTREVKIIVNGRKMDLRMDFLILTAGSRSRMAAVQAISSNRLACIGENMRTTRSKSL